MKWIKIKTIKDLPSSADDIIFYESQKSQSFVGGRSRSFRSLALNP